MTLLHRTRANLWLDFVTCDHGIDELNAVRGLRIDALRVAICLARCDMHVLTRPMLQSTVATAGQH